MSSSESEWHEALSSAFLQAREMQPNDRVAFLRRLSATDADMANWVERMLVAENKSSPLLGGSSHGPFLKFAAPEISGARIGRYTIQRRIGTGGMGAVYEAEQDQPQRRVAVKILPAGLGSQQAARRFEFESSVLARLRHPGIAQVYEAGVHREDGVNLPFFAMEFVPDAESITRYAKSMRLGLPDLLRLFMRVCEAVHHGHQRGVIHRDLKPDNILVDAQGDPKVIDFGVARAIDRDIDALTLQTQAGQLIGTIPYMSPEQVGGAETDPDIRTDVYALGVVLFELLTGRLPYDFENKSVIESIDLIRNAAPARARTLNAEVPADLDTIVAKALARDWDQRYQSVADLSADLRRFLDNEPIAARPPSLIYQLHKFGVRRRGVVIAAALFVGALIAGVIAERYRANQATLARNEAVAARDTADEATRDAQREAARANRVVAFLDDMLSRVTPDEARGRDVTLQEVLDAVADDIDVELKDAPQVEATIRYIIGNTYLAQGRYPEAEEILRAASALHEEHDWENEDTVLILRALARTHVRQRDLDAGLAVIEKAEQLVNRLPAIDPDVRSELLNTKSELLYLSGHAEQAVGVLEDILSRHESEQTEDSEDFHALRGNLATLYERVGRYDEAVEILTTEIEWYQAHPESGRSKLHNLRRTLAGTEVALGHHDRAITIFKELVDDVREHSGPNHPDLAEVLIDFGTMLMRSNQSGAAVTPMREAAEICERVYGPSHRKSADALGAWASALAAQARFDEAVPLQARAIGCYEATGDTESMYYGQALHQYADMLRMTNRCEEALQVERRSLAISQRAAGPEHPSTIHARSLLALIEVSCGDAERGVELLEDELAHLKRILPEGHPNITMAMLNLGGACILAGRIDKAIAYHESVLEGTETMGASGKEIRRQTLAQLAVLLQVAERNEDARLIIDRALAIDHDDANPGHAHMLVKTADASLRLTQGDVDDAIREMGIVWPRLDTTRMQNDFFAVIAMITKSRCLLAQDNAQEAHEILEQARLRLNDKFGRENPLTIWAISLCE